MKRGVPMSGLFDHTLSVCCALPAMRTLLPVLAILSFAGSVAGQDVFELVVERSLAADRELRLQREEFLVRLKAAQARVDWAEAGFIDVRKVDVNRQFDPAHLKRIRKHQQFALQRLTTLPLNVSSGAIINGSALNQMLDVLGPVAYEHEQRLRALGKMAPGPDDEEGRLRWQLLRDMETDLLLTPAMLEQVRFQTGLTGPKGIVGLQLDQGEIAQYQPLRERVETARTALLATELPEGLTEAELFTELKTAVDELTAGFHHDYWGKIQRSKEFGQSFGAEAAAYLRAKQQIRLLRNAVQRWSEEGRQPPEHRQFVRSHPAGQVSLIQVLAVVYESGWRFSEATINSEDEYRLLCDYCRRYYVSLASLDESLTPLRDDVQRAQADIERNEQIIQKAMSGAVSVEMFQAAGAIANAMAVIFD
jgi:hypothetical protein